MRDRSFGKRKKPLLSPDHNSKLTNTSKTSIYDKVRRQVDNLIKNEKSPRRLLKSKDKEYESNVFEKKKNPLIEESYNEEESRELTITKDPIPLNIDKPILIKDIFVKKNKIDPVVFNKPHTESSYSHNRMNTESPLFKLELDDIKSKLLSDSNNDKRQLSTLEGSGSGIKRRIDFSTPQMIVPFNHQIQSIYSSLIKSKLKNDNSVCDSQTLLVQQKNQKRYSIESCSIIKQNMNDRSIIKNNQELSKTTISDLETNKEKQNQFQNEMRFLNMNVDRLKKEIGELNEDLENIKFERNNAISNYNRASKKIQELSKDYENLQLRLMRTSSQFGQLIDYLYNLEDPRHITQLENIIGNAEKLDSEDLHVRLNFLRKQFSDVINLINSSKDKHLIEETGKILKNTNLIVK